MRVLDFGLAVLHQHREGPLSGLAGTLGYIAPELFTGSPATEASDLFALGVVAFELFTGEALFSQKHAADLISAVLKDAPLREHPRLSPRLHQRIGRLLSAKPEERPTAQAFLEELRRVRGQKTADSEPIRESFLQAATLVGREDELQQLRAALASLIEGHGQLLLIGGESGVGKSRLCAELRAQALVEGVQVLRGQVARDTGGGLGIFADALRLLSLSVPLSELEKSVLKPLVPDLPTLCGHAIADAPPLDAQSARVRLLQVLESVLRRGDTPRLLFLEDVHWARDDAMDLLRLISERLERHPLLIIATFRDDERPGLPRELPQGRLLRLPRLSANSIEKLSYAMLGEVGRSAGLVELLSRETEGNTFFIIEIMRALAVEAGGLEGIGSAKLPERIYTGGITAVLQRRLSAVAPALRPFLQVAAVAGRQLDLNVLHRLHRDLDSQLQACADASVLELGDATWRFSHDKFREQILADLSPPALRALHTTVADALLASYPDALPHASTLAYHYDRGEQPVPAAQYAGLAGEQALRRGALSEAVQHLERALQLQVQIGSPALSRGYTQMRLVQAYFGLGQLTDASRYVPKALADLGEPQPTSTPRRVASLGAAVIEQLWHRLRPTSQQPVLDEEARSRVLGLCAVTAAALEVYVYEGRLLDCAIVMGLLANSAERSQSPDERARGYSGLSYLFSTSPFLHAMKYFMKKAFELEPAVKEEATLCYVYRGCSISYQNIAEHDAAIRVAGQAMVIADRLGDTYSKLHAAIVRAHSLIQISHYDEAEELCRIHLDIAKEVQHKLMQGMWLTLTGNLHLRRGNFAQATDCYAKAHHAAADLGTLVTIGAAGGSVFCALRSGARGRALALFEPALSLLENEPATSNGFYDSYRLLAQAALELFQTATDDEEKRRLHKQLRRALWVLRRYALQYRLGRAGIELVLGEYAVERGRIREAQRRFQAAIVFAETAGMIHEGALSRLQLGNIMEGDEGRAERQRAVQVLQKIGAHFDAGE